MKKIFTLYLFLLFLINVSKLYADNNLEKNNTISDKTTQLLKQVDEIKIKNAVSTWDEFKDRDIEPLDFKLQDNDKTRIFLKVYYAKVKYAKRHLDEPQFQIYKPNTKQIDEFEILKNIINESLALLGFSEEEIITKGSHMYKYIAPPIPNVSDSIEELPLHVK